MLKIVFCDAKHPNRMYTTQHITTQVHHTKFQSLFMILKCQLPVVVVKKFCDNETFWHHREIHKNHKFGAK